MGAQKLHKLQKAEAALQSPSLSNHEETILSTGKSAGKPPAYIRNFSVYYRARPKWGWVCNEGDGDKVCISQISRSSYLGIGTPRLLQTKAIERSIGMD